MVGRVLLVVGGLTLIAPLVWWVVAPHRTAVLVDAEPLIAGVGVGTVIPLAGLIVGIVGLLWMWRIHRAPMRTDAPTWRYRARAR